MAVRAFKIDPVKKDQARQAVLGESGEALIDIITDNFLLRDSNTPDQAQAKAGIGEIVKFMRLLRKDENLLTEEELMKMGLNSIKIQ
tara:strand:+ start:277 stop:537 length:261 start_codon:yes stop_codon:yes gene_type:complete